MRVSTQTPTPRRPRKPAPKPSARQRWFFFVLGALVGGVIGYGIATGGPGPSRSLLDPVVAAWIVGPALVCGGLAALSPRAFLRPGGRFRWTHDWDDD